jgi:hypothetical protein
VRQLVDDHLKLLLFHVRFATNAGSVCLLPVFGRFSGTVKDLSLLRGGSADKRRCLVLHKVIKVATCGEHGLTLLTWINCWEVLTAVTGHLQTSICSLQRVLKLQTLVDCALKLLFVLDEVKGRITNFTVLHQIYSIGVLLKFTEFVVIFFVLHLSWQLWNVLVLKITYVLLDHLSRSEWICKCSSFCQSRVKAAFLDVSSWKILT